MGLFHRKIALKDLQNIMPISRFDLKMQCLAATKGDVDAAEKMYDFLAKDMQGLPDLTPTPPSTMEQVRNIAGNMFGWIKENKDDIIGAYNFFQSVRSGAPIETAAQVAGEVSEAVSAVPPVE